MPRPKGVRDEFFAMTNREIGEQLGLTHTRINQIVNGALAKLRVEFQKRGITGTQPTGESPWEELMKRAEEVESD